MKPDTTPFDYVVKRSNRKTLGIYIRGQIVEARAPQRMPRADIDRFVRQKSRWVSRKLNEQALQKAEALVIEAGESFPFIGRPYELKFQHGPRNNVILGEATLTLQTRLASTNKHKLLELWLKQQADRHMSEPAQKLASKLGVAEKITDIRFRKTKTKWGHCNSAGVLQFNPLIMMAPPAVIDYLIAHEVCHLVHMNHSPAYWAVVASVHPEYRQNRQWLRDHAHQLKFD